MASPASLRMDGRSYISRKYIGRSRDDPQLMKNPHTLVDSEKGEQLKKLVRTRASPDQAFVFNRTSRNRLGSPLPFAGEFELTITIVVADRRDARFGLSS